MAQQHVVDIAALEPVVRRVLPGARRSAIMSGLRQLSPWLGPGRNGSPASQRARLRVTRLRNLLAGEPPTTAG